MSAHKSTLSERTNAIAQVFAAMFSAAAVICSAFALTQTNHTLQMTKESLELTRKQLEDERKRHHENHQWAIRPVIMFERGTTKLTIPKEKRLEASSIDAIGKLINVGNGPGIDVTVEWRFEKQKLLENVCHASPDILMPDHRGSLNELPKAFFQLDLRQPQSFAGEVVIKCRDADNTLIKCEQPFIVEILFDDATGTSTILLKFDYVKLLDWSVVVWSA